MNDGDLFEFNLVFSDVRRVFPLRADDVESRQLMNSYFQAFRRYPLSRVRMGADACIVHGKRFPKPAEWIEAMPAVNAAAPYAELTPRESAEWLEAERLRWEGAPCGCGPCILAGVTHRPIRFVPEFDEHDRDVKVRIGERVVTRGHWAHGDELARWYRAKEDFYSQFRALLAQRSMTQKRKKLTFQQRMDEIFKPKPAPEREPGEEG